MVGEFRRKSGGAVELQCAKCGSNKIIPFVHMYDQGGNVGDPHLKAFVDSNPDAWVFKGTVFARLKAHICGDCGHTELVAESADKLWEAYCNRIPKT